MKELALFVLWVIGVVLIFASSLSGCMHETNPACAPDYLTTVIEPAYVDEVMRACAPYKSRQTCPDYPAIDAKYRAIEEDWQRCR